MPRVSVLHRPTGRTELPVQLTRSTMSTNQRPRGVGRIWTLAVLVPVLAGSQFARQDNDDTRKERTLYVWAGDQARVAPDFLAVIDFDEDSPRYGRVIGTVPIPGPGGSGNEPHHCICLPTRTSWPVAGCWL